MVIADNFNLIQHNTLAVESFCDRIITVESLSDLEALPKTLKPADVLVIGEGSNILLTKDINKTVIHIKPRKHITQVDNLVVSWSGTRWNELVDWAVEKNLGGIENLALIPGLVGAAPIQNIGAYGTELSDVLVWVEVYNWKTGTYHRYSHPECEFSYRESIFKNQDRPFIITRIALDLRPDSPLNLEYAPLKTFFGMMDKKPTYKDVAEAVSQIRMSKLPDPRKTPNAGSFFKNPIIDYSTHKKLTKKFPDIPIFPLADNTHFKTSAAWLLEQCGFKGKQEGDAGFSRQHALVLVNHGVATGKQLLQFAQTAKKAVKQKFNIVLEEEVRVI